MLKRFSLFLALLAFIGIPALAGAQATPAADEDPDFFKSMEGYAGGANTTYVTTSNDITALITVGSGVAQFDSDDNAKAALAAVGTGYIEFLSAQDNADVDASGVVLLDEAPDLGDEAIEFAGPTVFGSGDQSFTFNAAMVFVREGNVVFGVQAVSGGDDAQTTAETLTKAVLDRNPEAPETPIDGNDPESALWGWLLTPEDIGDGFAQDELVWTNAEGDETQIPVATPTA